jgi:hypothetical protein
MGDDLAPRQRDELGDAQAAGIGNFRRLKVIEPSVNLSDRLYEHASHARNAKACLNYLRNAGGGIFSSVVSTPNASTYARIWR